MDTMKNIISLITRSLTKEECIHFAVKLYFIVTLLTAYMSQSPTCGEDEELNGYTLDIFRLIIHVIYC